MISRRALIRGGAAAAAGLLAPAFAGPASAAWTRAWEGLDPRRVLDCHVHAVGVGAGGSGCWVNERHRSPLRHPYNFARFRAYLGASGVRDLDTADQAYLDRLAALVRAQEPHGRLLLLAFDQVYGEGGTPDPESSEFYTPNDHVLAAARANPDVFVPAASIHPYRPDALDELDRVEEQGALAVKWLPNSQGIDPASPRCDAFYERLAMLEIPILTHAGEEMAVDAPGRQELGNPLRLRRPLAAGVRVLVAHCASLGEQTDHDASEGRKAQSFDLFLRLMDEPRWRGRLFGDVSALPQVNRCGRPLRTVLQRTDIHERLVNGSDYPLPGIGFLVQTGLLEKRGYLSAEDRRAVDELRADPLAFDLALKRALAWAGGGGARSPDGRSATRERSDRARRATLLDGATSARGGAASPPRKAGQGLPASVFEARPELFPRLP